MAGWKCGVLLCTDAMFLEDARELRSQGAEVIFVPRATSRACDNLWHDTLSLIARHNGCYVISSNRSRSENSLIDFSGLGFAFSPEGKLLVHADEKNPRVTIDIDIDAVAKQRNEYPVYLSFR